MIWREKRWLLLLLALVLAANAIFFFTYRVQYQSRLDALDERLAAAEGDLARARNDRMTAERTLQSYRQVERDVQVVLAEHWSTKTARLTRMIAEVKNLALASSMQPAAYEFRETAATLSGKKRSRSDKDLGVTAVGVTFAVGGTYDESRRLINHLELSGQFVIIDEVALVAREGSQLQLNLHLTTLFRDEAPAAPNGRL